MADGIISMKTEELKVSSTDESKMSHNNVTGNWSEREEIVLDWTEESFKHFIKVVLCKI